jgi:hypothetical protein
VTINEFHNLHGTNKIEVYKLSKDARHRLEDLNLDDVDDLFEIRFSGKERVLSSLVGSPRDACDRFASELKRRVAIHASSTQPIDCTGAKPTCHPRAARRDSRRAALRARGR